MAPNRQVMRKALASPAWPSQALARIHPNEVRMYILFLFLLG